MQEAGKAVLHQMFAGELYKAYGVLASLSSIL
jgi:hypothetical protein